MIFPFSTNACLGKSLESANIESVFPLPDSPTIPIVFFFFKFILKFDTVFEILLFKLKEIFKSFISKSVLLMTIQLNC